MSPTTDIAVRYSAGTYLTSSVGKQRASNTAGPEGAAAALGRKLYGESFSHVEQIGEAVNQKSSWRIQGKPIFAYCWQTGLIEFGPVIPEDAIGVATGLDIPLRTVVGVLACHGQGKSEGLLLVPGVPEAPDRSLKRADALRKWVNWCAKGNGKEGRYGVSFGGKL